MGSAPIQVRHFNSEFRMESAPADVRHFDNEFRMESASPYGRTSKGIILNGIVNM